jgi:hypothetical protein
MAFDREAAKADGYTDDEINAYLQAEAEKNKETPVTVDPGEPPAPTTVIKPVEPTASSVATTAGIGLAPYVVPAAGVAAAALGGGKVYQGWKEGVDAARQYSATQAANAATHAATQELKTLQQIARGTGPEAEVARQRIIDIINSRSAQGAQAGAQAGAQQTAQAGAQAAKAGPGMMGRVAGAIAPTLAMAEAPGMLTLPYQMAAYEQAKIRQNPNAPGLEFNPYAQTVRGEAPTQRAAGAMNQRTALINQQYGGLTRDEQSRIEEDIMKMMMLMKAANKVLGQQQ